MITNTNIVAEIDRQVKQAQAKNTDDAMKEALIAIRALCNVAFGEEQQIIVPSEGKVLSSSPSHNMNHAMKLEQGYTPKGNDDSIFDF